jgi:4-amino-4-deoxychorismate lyase
MAVKRPAGEPTHATEVVAKAAKTSIKVLDNAEFWSRMKDARQRTNPDGHFLTAMYSSLVDGIVTDPDLMIVPLDDHAFVRGHAVFDTATLSQGCVYRLGIHLDRLFASARDARLKLPFGDSEEENRTRITDIVCATCVASGRKDGSIRYFLSAGPGNFNFTSAGCEPSFYCVVYGALMGGFDFKAIKETTMRISEVPMKPPLLARVKSNNYMLNCITGMEAQKKGGTFGIAIRDDDTVAEGCVVNCACITKDRVLLTPQFGDILSGTTIRKAMALVQANLVGDGKPLQAVRQEIVPLTTLKAAEEVMLMGGDTHLWPVSHIDGEPVGRGIAGPVAKQIYELLLQDANTESSEDHIKLHY